MKNMKADVAIISAGTAGLSAAIAAAESGASVIAFEKSNHTGGTAIMANGLFAVESRLQRIWQYPLTREEAFKIYMDFVRLDTDARLMKSVIDRSAETIDWLEHMGVEFWGLGGHGIGMHYTWHLVKGDAKQMDPEYVKGATFTKYGTSMYNSIGVPIPVLNPGIVEKLAVRDRDIYTDVVDYGVPSRNRPTLRNVSYEELKSGRVAINDESVKVAPLSSLRMAHRVSETLKRWITEGRFTLTQHVEPISTERVFKPMKEEKQ